MSAPQGFLPRPEDQGLGSLGLSIEDLGSIAQSGLGIAAGLTAEKRPQQARVLSAVGAGLGGINQQRQMTRALETGAALFEQIGSTEIAEILRTDPRGAVRLAQAFGGDLGDLYKLEITRLDKLGTDAGPASIKDVLDSMGLDAGDFPLEGRQAAATEIRKQQTESGGIVDPNAIQAALGAEQQPLIETERRGLQPRELVKPGERLAPTRTQEVPVLSKRTIDELQGKVRTGNDVIASLDEFDDFIEAAPEEDINFLGSIKDTIASLGEVGPNMVSFLNNAANIFDARFDETGATAAEVSEFRDLARQLRTREVNAAKALKFSLAIQLAAASGQGRLSVATIKGFMNQLPIGGITTKASLLDRIDALRQNQIGRRGRAATELRNNKLNVPPIVPARPPRQRPAQSNAARQRFNQIARELRRVNPGMPDDELRERARQIARDQPGGP